jgi:protein tyrosine/serine phosphatase
VKLNRQIVLLACTGFLAATVGCCAGETNTPPAPATISRPVTWAQPLVLPGITNLYQVTTNLYRGAQPTAAGMAQLKAMGIKTVINLRSFHSDKDEVTGTGLKSIRFEVKPWHAEQEDVIGFLKAVTDTNNLPVFVHCQRGADRTGMMCAMYRIVVCGWTKPEAIEEMKAGGYHFSPVWRNLVAFVEQADIADIKRRTGLPEK